MQDFLIEMRNIKVSIESNVDHPFTLSLSSVIYKSLSIFRSPNKFSSAILKYENIII